MFHFYPSIVYFLYFFLFISINKFSICIASLFFLYLQILISFFPFFVFFSYSPTLPLFPSFLSLSLSLTLVLSLSFPLAPREAKQAQEADGASKQVSPMAKWLSKHPSINFQNLFFNFRTDVTLSWINTYNKCFKFNFMLV